MRPHDISKWPAREWSGRQRSRPIVLDALLQNMAEVIRSTVGPGIEVRAFLANGIWTTSCDANQLENALLNLAINARDAMMQPTSEGSVCEAGTRQGGGTLTLSTTERRLDARDVVGHHGAEPGEYVEVAVSDTGIGMNRETQVRAFDPFFTTKPFGHGTGLGLSQVYGFVRQSGGFVVLESTVGQGTTVRLYLPRYEALGEDNKQKLLPGGGQSSNTGAGRTILLVGDEAEMRELTAETLTELGYRVVRAASGPAALRLLDEADDPICGHLNVLVTDIGLPGGLTGRQLADAVRERRPALPVLFITGHVVNALDLPLAPGMEVVGKPFTADVLAARIQAMLGEPWRPGSNLAGVAGIPST